MLTFLPLTPKVPKKTEEWSVVATKAGTDLGKIRWFSPWRRYVFYPQDCTLFDANCLIRITDFLIIETNKRKETWGIHGS